MTPLDELALLLRPAGGGLYVVSTGVREQQALQRRLYDAATTDEIQAKWRAALARIPEARGIVLGIPSDVGAGYQRGANMGPQAIREAVLTEESSLASDLGVVDIGDVFVVPQLLHDSMISDDQRARTALALYPEVSEEERRGLPVSPLSIAERALELVFQLNPGVAPFVLGGDHSTAWPVAAALARARKDRWGIVQIDAHTDLLAERLGVKYCFATWSYHANDLLGRDGRLVQVGIRATRFPQSHWEGTLGVRQLWAAECRAAPEASLDAIIAHLRERKIGPVYFSNDIDGTDDRFADATGTSEPDGLDPELVVELIRRLGAEVGILGGDVMEVAPTLRPRPDSTQRTVALAGRYLRETLRAWGHAPPPKTG
jgi:arginase family enzyme